MAERIRPRRSALYMPGSNERALEKARTLPADVLILDLEDAVAPEAKSHARRRIATALERGFGTREVVIRINGLDTEWGADDLAMAVAARPDAILVPKIGSPDMLAAIAATSGDLPLWAMIETPRAVLDIAAIAAAARQGVAPLAVLVIGTNDLAKETRARIVPGRAPMLAWLSLAVAAARAEGLDILDGVFNDVADTAGFAAEAAQGRDLGMDGKTLIHPSQIEAANAAFAPSDEEVEQARRILAAFAAPENAGKGAIALDGRMVERLHATIAGRTLRLAEAIAERST